MNNSAENTLSRDVLRAAGWLSAAAVAVFLAAVLAYARWGGVLLAEVNDRVGETQMQHALDLHQGGFLEDAEDAYRSALEAIFAGEQNRAFTLKQLGALLVEQERWRDAAPFLEQALESPRAPITAYEPLAQALLALGLDDRAREVVEAWQAATDAPPARASAWEPAAGPAAHALQAALARYYHGRIMLRRNDLERARALFAEGHALVPGRGNALELARFAYREEEYRTALEYLDSFFLTGPRGAYFLEGLGLREQVLTRFAP